jgi:hypothetical protein
VFSVPALITGTYSVTVSLTGFKTAVLNNVIVNAGVPANVRATLEVGGLAEEVLVTANSALVPMQNATVGHRPRHTAGREPPADEPKRGRFRRLPARRDDAGRHARFDRQRPAAVDHQYDARRREHSGQHQQDDGRVLCHRRAAARRRGGNLVHNGGVGAESTGSGATQIRYTTKSGTNDFHGSVFHQYRSDALNTTAGSTSATGCRTPSCSRTSRASIRWTRDAPWIQAAATRRSSS